MERMWMTLSDFLANKQFHHGKTTILQDVANGLSYIHEKDIIHCNLTGNSILLTEKVRAKIADFGRAIVYQSKAFYNIPVTTEDILDYMPPEIFKPIPSYSTKLDVFSFGCVIIHTVTQEPPVPDCDKFVEISEIGKCRVYSEIDRRSTVIKKLKSNDALKLYNIVLECLQDDPSDRPTAKSLYSLLKNQATKKFDQSMFE